MVCVLASRAAVADVLAIERFLLGEMRLNGIPGIAIAIVEGGETSLLRAYGTHNVTKGTSLLVDTPMELASVSKSLTALGVLRLERSGQLDRNESVVAYLPELRAKGWDDITVQSLLRHRSGLRRRDDFQVPCCGSPGHLDLRVATARLGAAGRPKGSRDQFSYANSNFVLLAAIVERVSGVPFPRYMREHVFRPLGLRRTTLDATEARGWKPADGHEWQWGRVLPSPSGFSGWYGSSRVKASASDLAAYMLLLLDPAASPPSLARPEPEWWENLGPDYDLGWEVQRHGEWPTDNLVVLHTGKLWGGNSAIVLAPERRAGVAVLANLGADRAGHIAWSVLSHLHGAELPEAGRPPLSERPDTWAIVFLAVAAIVLALTLAYGVALVRQTRSGVRAWHLSGMRLVRTAVLAALSIWLVQRYFVDPAVPQAALPTTVGRSLPVLVGGSAALFLVAAFGSVLPRRALDPSGPRSESPHTLG